MKSQIGQLSANALSALQSFAERNGRTWKSKLRDKWFSGNYDSDDDSQSLQSIRNSLGPSWLVSFKIPVSDSLAIPAQPIKAISFEHGQIVEHDE